MTEALLTTLIPVCAVLAGVALGWVFSAPFSGDR